MTINDDQALAEENEFLAGIQLPHLSHEENIVHWLCRHYCWGISEIAPYLGKSRREVSKIYWRMLEKVQHGVAFRPGQKVLLIKDADNPHRNIIIQAGGYPKIKVGRGRPGKYEKKRDYDFVRKCKKRKKKTD